MASFTDDFNRADSTSLGASWVEVSGDWSIVSGQLSPGAAGGTIILRAAGAMASDDHFAQVTIAATAPASHGVWCRGSSNLSDGYLFRNDGSSWDLFSVVGGSFTLIGTYAAAAAPGDVAKVQAVGSTIKGYVNGVQRVAVVDTFVTTGTNVGIRSESAGALRFDDFAAGDVTAGATLGVAGSTEAAQQLTGSKAATVGTAVDTETAQPVTGSKTATSGVAGESEAAQPMAGGKTAALGPASEADSAQALAGAKTAPLPAATQTETAQPLTGAKSGTLDTAAEVDEARQLTGAKSAALTPAAETDSARPLAGPTADEDVDITVGAPYGSLYSVRAPHSSGWEVGAPC